jgi:hypothetical protein
MLYNHFISGDLDLDLAWFRRYMRVYVGASLAEGHVVCCFFAVFNVFNMGPPEDIY